MIPIEFYNARKAGELIYPIVYTVEQLIEQLEKLPKGLKIESNWDNGVKMVVYNVGNNPCLQLEDVDRHPKSR